MINIDNELVLDATVDELNDYINRLSSLVDNKIAQERLREEISDLEAQKEYKELELMDLLDDSKEAILINNDIDILNKDLEDLYGYLEAY